MRADLPPEAFTKDTLQEAFQWLQTQPEPVRASIHTPERLVSLYRKSQRLDQNSDTPVSSKKFIDDLKNLATSLNEFSTPTPRPKSDLRTSVSISKPTPVETFVEPKIEPKKVVSSTSTSTISSVIENKTMTSTVTTSSDELDSVSQSRIKEVQKRFNLSTENEALRLLITLGFEKFSEFK